MKSHLKSEHDMVKYEVEFILHLCLINRKEREEIIKILGPRLDWFVEKGVIEKDINLFETKESTSEGELNTEKIFQHAKSKENVVDNTNEVTQELIAKQHSEVISLEVGDIDKVFNLKEVAKAIEQNNVEYKIQTIMQGEDVPVPDYNDDNIEDTKTKDVEIINLEVDDKVHQAKGVDDLGKLPSFDVENKTVGENFKNNDDLENDDLELTLSDDEVDDMEISFKQGNSMKKDLQQCKDSTTFRTEDTLEEPMEAELNLPKDEMIKNAMESEVDLSAPVTPGTRSRRAKVSRVEKGEVTKERMVGRVRTRSTVAKEVVVKRTREEKRKEQPRRKVTRRGE